MSTTASRSDPTVECHNPDCSELGRKWSFHHGKYCSNECERIHEGWEALKDIRFDHTVCCTCFQPLKTINPPPSEEYFIESGSGWTLGADGEPHLEVYRQDVTADSACGFQFLSEHAVMGERQRSGQITTGTICDYCGDTDHTFHYAPLAGRAATGRLVTRLQDEDIAVDPHTLHRVHESTADLDLAVGHALQD